MTQTQRRYDLVVFAQTDSLVRVSAMAQLRLENYLFTQESMVRAYELLEEGGDLVLYNSYNQDWVVRKLQEALFVATGHFPKVLWREDRTGDFTRMLMVGDETAARGRPSTDLGELDLPSDDWPFVYLESRGIPRPYLVAMIVLGIFVTALALAVRRSTAPSELDEQALPRRLIKLAFMLMGMAFLLLETKGVIQFSLLFGTTWANNSLVFLAALLLVLAANAVAQRVEDMRVLPGAFALLVLSCLITLVYPIANLLSVESAVLRFILASLMTFSPIFFANLLFSLVFRDQPVAEHLFGWNLIGATIGGLVEYMAMWSGYNALALVVAISYTAVFVLIFQARRIARHTAVPGAERSAG